MKVFSDVISPAGNRRILFACGLEDIKILQGLVINAKMNTPRVKTEENNTLGLISRLKSMSNEFSYFLNEKEPKRSLKKDTKCPHCERSLRGQKALDSHILTVHSRGYEQNNNV